jgi:ferredoxin, 2Fe-2S
VIAIIALIPLAMALGGWHPAITSQGFSGQDMVKVTFVEPDGSERTLDGDNGFSLMEVAVRNGVAGIDADCGGACACATCHVYVDPEWFGKVGEPGDMEKDMLEFAGEPRETSRLSCQIRLSTALDGLKVTVPESQS